jgi:hypothetical protein
MSIRRTVIIPAILTLGMAGSIVAGSALTTAVAQVPAAATSTAHPDTFYQS